MVSVNPFAEFRVECERILRSAVETLFPDVRFESLSFGRPPNPEFGQLASSLCFELAKQVGKKAPVLAEEIVRVLDRSSFVLVEHVDAAGVGYINFHADFSKFTELVFQSAKDLDIEYGSVRVENPLDVIVEHTSANPLHPLHIGQARNPILGDALARLLRLRGHRVRCHFYVDDVGRQSAVLAYGYEKLGRPKPDDKADHYLGRVYTITSCLVEIGRLKGELKHAKTIATTEEARKITRDLDDWVSIAAELNEKYPELFNRLLEVIGKDQDSEKTISMLNKKYEAGDQEARVIREVSELCLKGLKETLDRIDVEYDSWDWESDLAWSSKVRSVIEELKKTPYVSILNGVPEFNAERVLEETDLKASLGLKDSYEIPSLTLMRSNGTTLYPTRDIAYTLWKFENAERVINVVGMDQRLPQLQLKIALHALGRGKSAENLVHFAYNLVNLPGYRMSSRRGRYITFDETMDEAVRRAYEEVSKRSPNLPEEEKRKIARLVGLGAVRYALIEVDPSKPVEFTWDRVLNFEKNSAPYIQYSHARACSILRKAEQEPETLSCALLKEPLEHQIILAVAGLPDIFVEAAELLKPSLVADYANSIADRFNTFYNALPVIKATPKGLSDARLCLVDAVRIVLRNSLHQIGIVAPERM